MNKLLSGLDPKLRIGMAAFIGAFACVFGWLCLSLLTRGPWYGILLTAVVVGGAIHASLTAWPSKLPAPLAKAKDRVERARAKATKSAAGKFMWGALRSIVGGMLMWKFVDAASEVEGFVRVTIVVAFAVSFGFFRIQAAVWAGVVVGIFGYYLARAGLSVDFADPVSRDDLQSRWMAGEAISWWWPLGFASTAPVWIAVAAIIVKLGEQMDLATERRDAAAAARAIEERRKRLKARRQASSFNPVALAEGARQQAENRLASVAKSDGGSVSDKAIAADKAAAAALKVQSPSERLEAETAGAVLANLIEHARGILRSEELGIGMDTPHRRGFDRVVQSLSPAQINLLCTKTIPGWDALLRYYDDLCGTEHTATLIGDGAVVDSTPVSRHPEEDEVTAEEVSTTTAEPWGTFERGTATSGPVQNDDDDDDGDAMDRTFGAKELQAPAPVVGRRKAMGDDLVKALSAVADVVSDPKEPVEEVLPLRTNAAPTAPAEATDPAKTMSVQSGKDMLEEDEEPDTGRASEEAQLAEKPAADTQPDPDRSTETEPDVEARKVAAGIAMSGKMDRTFILSAQDFFASADDMAAAIGLPASMLAEPYEAYHALVALAKQEAGIDALISAGNVDQVKLVLGELKSAGWPADEVLVERAEAWIVDAEAEAGAAETARVQAEEERLAREAAEEEARRQREQAEREGAEEQARLVELNDRRTQAAICIVMDHVSDDLLDEGPELFPAVHDLASALKVEVNEKVETTFETFRTRCMAKEKYGVLATAMKNEDIDAVTALLERPEDFAAYDGSTLSLEDAQAWVDGERAKDRAFMLDEVQHAPSGRAGEAARSLMRRRARMTDEQVELIDVELPRALQLAATIQQLIDLTGDNVASEIIVHLQKAETEIWKLASLIAAEPAQTRDYVQAFFPKALRTADETPWETIERLAATPPADIFEEPVAAPVEVAPVAIEPKVVSRVIDVFGSGEVIEEVDVQTLDPMEEIGKIVFKKAKGRSHYETMATMLAANVFSESEMKEGFGTNSQGHLFRLGEGRGCVMLTPYALRSPVWYSESEGLVYVFNDEGAVGTFKADDFYGKLARPLGTGERDQDKVEAIIAIFPHATENGLRSFEPLIKQAGGRIMVHNESLKSTDIRGFMEKIKGA